jgi:hypothetical protein
MVAPDTGLLSNDTAELAAPTAHGVIYSPIDGAPGLQFFDCQPYRARLTTKSCASRWRTAQRATGMAAARLEKCRTCPIGAAHAGEAVTYFSPLFGRPICCRCGKVSMRRMILRGRLCISCVNRQYEFIRGRNAKGNPPKNLAPLNRRTIRYAVEGGGVETMTLEHSADLAELMVGVLRKTRGRISFGFNGGPPMPGATTA